MGWTNLSLSTLHSGVSLKQEALPTVTMLEITLGSGGTHAVKLLEYMLKDMTKLPVLTL